MPRQRDRSPFVSMLEQIIRGLREEHELLSAAIASLETVEAGRGEHREVQSSRKAPVRSHTAAARGSRRQPKSAASSGINPPTIH